MVAEKDQGIGGDIVGGAGKFGVDQGHIAVGGGKAGAAFHRVSVLGQGPQQGLVGGLPAAQTGLQGLQIGGQALRTLRMQPGQGFRHRQQDEAFRVVCAALGHGVEEAHGVHLVAEELHTDRRVVGRRKDIQNAAPHGKLSHALHQRAPAVAHFDQPRTEVLQGKAGADFQGQGRGKEAASGQSADAEGVPGGDEQPLLPTGQVVEQTQPLLLPAAGDGRGAVKGQIPGGQDGDLRVQKGGQLRLGAPRRHFILAEDDCRTLCIVEHGGDEVGAVDLRGAGNTCGLIFLQALHQPPVVRQSAQQGEKLFHRTSFIDKNAVNLRAQHFLRTHERGKQGASLFSVFYRVILLFSTQAPCQHGNPEASHAAPVLYGRLPLNRAAAAGTPLSMISRAACAPRSMTPDRSFSSSLVKLDSTQAARS